MLYAGDYGEIITLDCGIPTAGLNVAIWVKRPDGTIVTWNATPAGITQLQYTLTAVDLNIPGIYTLRSIFDPNGILQHGDPIQLFVYPVT